MTMYNRGSLLTDLPSSGEDEQFDTVLAHPAARIERIVSLGHASPPGFWYDQPEDEWVLLAAGQAELVMAPQGEAETHFLLTAGDWVLIPAHCRHRVEATSHDAVWLAVHLSSA